MRRSVYVVLLHMYGDLLVFFLYVLIRLRFRLGYNASRPLHLGRAASIVVIYACIFAAENIILSHQTVRCVTFFVIGFPAFPIKPYLQTNEEWYRG